MLNDLKALCDAPTKVPGLVSFYGAYHVPESGQISIVLEYVDGGSLADVQAKVRPRGGGAGWQGLCGREAPAGRSGRATCLLVVHAGDGPSRRSGCRRKQEGGRRLHFDSTVVL